MDSASDERLALRTVLLTSITMVAFASNSLLCRLALQHASIDAASFSSIRLVSGAVTLAVIARAGSGGTPPARADWPAAAMLFVYVAFFSFAYLTLSAGTGALILSARCSSPCWARACARANGSSRSAGWALCWRWVGWCIWSRPASRRRRRWARR